MTGSAFLICAGTGMWTWTTVGLRNLKSFTASNTTTTTTVLVRGMSAATVAAVGRRPCGVASLRLLIGERLKFFSSGCAAAGGADHSRRSAASGTNRAANYFLRAAVLTGTGSALFGLYSWSSTHSAFVTSVVHAHDHHHHPPSLLDPTSASNGLKLTLYQYQTCPFCCKVRAFLDYSGLPYDIVEVNPVFRQQIKFSKWRKVPILIVEGQQRQQLNDSSLIISVLSSALLRVDDDRGPPSRRRAAEKSLDELLDYYPVVKHVNDRGKEVEEVQNRYFVMYADDWVDQGIAESQAEERKWRMWADDQLVHMLSPNVYRSPSEALQAFRWFSTVGNWKTHFSFFERAIVVYVGAAVMYLLGKRLKKRHVLKDDVRESLYDVCNEWTAAVGTQRPFMGGDKPNLADLAVYGVLSSIEGCSAFDDVRRNTNIQSWFQRMKTSVNSHSGYVSSRHGQPSE